MSSYKLHKNNDNFFYRGNGNPAYAKTVSEIEE